MSETKTTNDPVADARKIVIAAGGGTDLERVLQVLPGVLIAQSIDRLTEATNANTKALADICEEIGCHP